MIHAWDLLGQGGTIEIEESDGHLNCNHSIGNAPDGYGK